MTCPGCGSEAPEGARFCAECGRALRVIDDERRVVTVLFADLVGFTSLSERLDPEQVKNLVDRCFDRLAADVTAFGGQVDKIVGDAMVALFGAPIAHEDDAERAVRAALRMQETLEAEAGDIGHPLRIRVGVNTGEVLVGAMRAAGSVTAMGDVVNTASRLQTSAAPGEVLVGAATHAATEGVIAYEERGLLSAKGREDPVETWRALAPTLPPGYRARREDVPIVGREDELGMLHHAVGMSITNHRALLVMLVGDVGMGKSRLADEVSCWSGLTHRSLVREGRCVPYGEANVWWPVADALREGLDVKDDDPIETAQATVRSSVAAAINRPETDPEVGRVTDGLLTLLGYEASEKLDPSTVREDASRALVVYLRSLAERRPLVLQISDLHWADDAVLALLDNVLSQLQHQRVVVLATARPTLLDRWAPAPGRHNALVLHLDPLGREASAELLGHLMDGPVTDAVADMLLDRSGGNPFFLEELVNIVDGEAGGDATKLAGLPSTLQGLVAARLDDLSPGARTVLQDASVIGQRGPITGLREMTKKLDRWVDLDEALAELVDEEILGIDGENWEFGSDLVREVAYRMITKSDRASAHLGIAAHLETTYASRTPHPVWLVDQMAHHYGQAMALSAELGSVGRVSAMPADLPERALRWVVEAADRARRDQSIPTASRLYDQAIGLLDATRPEHQRQGVRLHQLRAELALEGWDLDAAQDHIARAAALAESLGDRFAAAHVLVVRGGVEQRAGDIDRAVTTLTTAIQEFEDLGDDAGRALALRQRAMVEIFVGRTVEAEESALEALAAFESVGDRSGQGWALQNLAWIAFVTGRTDEADQRVQAAVTIFSDLVDTRGMAWSLGLLAWLRFQQHRVHEAAALAEQVLEEARSRNDSWATGMMLLLIASVRLWTGSTLEAVELSEKARRLFDRIGDAYGLGQALSVVGRAKVMAGDIDEGFAHLKAVGDPVSDRMTGAARLAAAVQVGEPSRGQDMLELLVEEGIDAQDIDVLQAEAAMQRGDLDAAVAAIGSGVDDLPDHPSLVASRALLAAARGTGEAGLLADRVAGIEGSTYLDQVTAHVAAALEASCRADGEVEAIARLDVARDLVSHTEDRVAVAYVAVAAAAVARRLADPQSDVLHDRAQGLLDELGLEAHGWSMVFGQAVGIVPTPTA